MAVITLLSNLSPKQKKLLASLDAQGIKYKLKKVDGRTVFFIKYDKERRWTKWDGSHISDYVDDDYMISNFDLAIGEWGD